MTIEEAGVLAAVLVENLEAQGSRFRVALTTAGVPMRIEGAVDWVGHAGFGTVTVGDAPGYDFIWTNDAVLQALPGLGERMAGQGRPGVEWVVHPADPSGARLDILAAVLTGLAATTPDNPVNLQQRDDVDLLREDELGGAAVRVFRSGALVLWIGLDDGRLRRLEAPLGFGDEPAIIDLDDGGPVRVDLPDVEAVVEAGEIPEIYAELTSVGVL